jgi:hypothetical protein
MRLSKFFKNQKVYIWKEDFVIAKAKRFLPEAFAVIRDKNEITVIIEESKIKKKDVIEMEKGWKILTFDMVLPFELVGFLAKISGALAKARVSIFAISSYSTDHILVKKKDLPKAIKALKGLEFKIENLSRNKDVS